jgi:hypothetical protein
VGDHKNLKMGGGGQIVDWMAVLNGITYTFIYISLQSIVTYNKKFFVRKVPAKDKNRRVLTLVNRYPDDDYCHLN